MSWLSTCTPTKRTGRSRNRNVPRFFSHSWQGMCMGGTSSFFFQNFPLFCTTATNTTRPGRSGLAGKTAAALEQADTQPQHTAHARGLSIPLFLLSLWGFSWSHGGPQRPWPPKMLGFATGVILFCHGSARRPLEFNSVTPGGKTLHFGREGDLEPLGTTVGQREDPRRRQTKRGILGG